MTKDVSVDALRGVDIRLFQPPKGPRVNVDTMLLAGFAKVRRGDRVCELGCAHGAISLILARRRELSVVGVELQEDLARMAEENGRLNGLEDRVAFIHGDLRRLQILMPPQGFDVVVSNPPYGDPDRHRVGKTPSEAVARHGLACTVDDVASACRYLLGDRGRAYLVFSAERLPELLCSFKTHGLEPKALRPVYPKEGREASVFLVKAIRSASPGLRLLPPLTILGEDGRYTEDLQRYYTLEGYPCP